MKTVFFVSLHIDNWGAERSTCSLAVYMKSLGYRVVLLIPREGKIMGFIRQYDLEYEVHYFRGCINNKGTNYFRAAASSLINLFQLVRLLIKLKKKSIKPDIVYSNTLVHCFGIVLAKAYKVPHIQHIRENIDAFGMHFNWGYKPSMQIIRKNSYKVICTCNAVAERYKNDICADKLTYEYNGVPVKDYIKVIKKENDVFAVVYVGRLDEDKRPQDVFLAINQMVTIGNRNIRLDVFGTGLLEADLKQYITDNNLDNYILMKGFQSSIDYSSYYVGVMSSTFEAFARSTLEYMMNGLAVIGSNSGGTKEQIVHGETGYLYKADDAGDLFKYLNDLYHNREKCIEFGRNGRERVVEHFSQERYVKGVSKYFIDALNDKRL